MTSDTPANRPSGFRSRKLRGKSGYGLLKEAMAAGLPVLSTTHAGIPEVVAEGRSGILVEEGSVDALVGGLERMSAARSRWPEMGRAGRAIVDAEYNLAVTLPQWDHLYRSLL